MPQTTILLGSVLLEIMSNGFILKSSFQQYPPLPEIFISICWEVTEKAQGENVILYQGSQVWQQNKTINNWEEQTFQQCPSPTIKRNVLTTQQCMTFLRRKTQEEWLLPCNSPQDPGKGRGSPRVCNTPPWRNATPSLRMRRTWPAV